MHFHKKKLVRRSHKLPLFPARGYSSRDGTLRGTYSNVPYPVSRADLCFRHEKIMTKRRARVCEGE